MDNQPSALSRPVSRRTMLGSGAIAGAGLWVAPSILTLDRAAAALGSCGAKPRQVDFSRWAGSLLPGSFLSDDSSVSITFTQSDPDNVQDTFWAGRVFNGTINGRDNPLITAMTNARNGDEVVLQFDFSVPIQLSFFLIDVDASGSGRNGWQDTVSIEGQLAGGPLLDPTSITVGGAHTQTTPNTIRGDFSTTGPDGNAEVDFQDPIDRLIIHHADFTGRRDFQWIGVHDFHWC